MAADNIYNLLIDEIVDRLQNAPARPGVDPAGVGRRLRRHQRAAGNVPQAAPVAPGNVATPVVTQVSDSLATLDNFIKSQAMTDITAALTKAGEFKESFRDAMDEARRKHADLIREVNTELLADQKLHHREMETDMKDLISDQTVLTEIREATLKTRTETDEKLAKLAHNINGNLNLIIQKLMSNSETIVGSQRANADMVYKQCLNTEEVAMGGYLGCTYYNCNHLGNGDFATRVEQLCKANPDTPVVIHGCMFHEQLIKSKPTLQIVAQSKITSENTSFMLVSRFSSIDNSALRKFVLSNTLDTTFKTMMYLQLIKDTFGVIAFPQGHSLAGKVVFKNAYYHVDKLFSTGSTVTSNSEDPDYTPNGISKIEFTLKPNTTLQCLTFTLQNQPGATLDIYDFRTAFSVFQGSRFIQFLVPNANPIWTGDVFLKELRKILTI